MYRSLGKLNQNALAVNARWNFIKLVKIHVAFCRRCNNHNSVFHHHAGILPLAHSLFCWKFGGGKPKPTAVINSSLYAKIQK